MKPVAMIAALIVALLTPGPTSAANDVIRPYDALAVKQLLEANKGRPVIVHFWGLTCGNCMVELKDWGAFARAHPDAMLVLVNWDQRGARPEQVRPALQKAGLGSIPSFALNGGFEEKLRFGIDRDWMGELPYTRLIAPDGSSTAFSGSADFANLRAWLARESH